MKIILEKRKKEERADYRENNCILCGEECNPNFRFFYWSKEKDKYGNSIIEDEISSCEKCYSKLNKMFT